MSHVATWSSKMSQMRALHAERDLWRHTAEMLAASLRDDLMDRRERRRLLAIYGETVTITSSGERTRCAND